MRFGSGCPSICLFVPCLLIASRLGDVILQQESLPAWTQEAYRPPCSEYSFCCPTWVPPQQGTPRPGLGGYPTWVPNGRVPPSWPRGYPAGGSLPGYPLSWPRGYRTPLAGYPPSWPGSTPPPPQLDLAGYPPPGVCLMEFWVMLQSIMGYGYPPVDRQIDGWMDRWTDKCQNITFRRTTYAGGNEERRWLVILNSLNLVTLEKWDLT